MTTAVSADAVLADTFHLRDLHSGLFFFNYMVYHGLDVLF